MLEQIFGSKTRVDLMRLFLSNPDRFFYVRELTRNLKIHLNSIRRELANLEKMGIIKAHTKADLEKEAGRKIKDNKKYYKLNRDFIFLEELRSLIVKAHLVLEKSLMRKIKNLGKVYFVLMSGVFVGREDAPVDLLIAGRVSKRKMASLIKLFEKELGQTIRFTIMNKEDFLYRWNVADKFLSNLLERKNLILIDELLNTKKESA